MKFAVRKVKFKIYKCYRFAIKLVIKETEVYLQLPCTLTQKNIFAEISIFVVFNLISDCKMFFERTILHIIILPYFAFLCYIQKNW